MENPLTIIDMARSLTRHAATRQALITENVANADTPNYRARDVLPFADLYRAPGEAERATAFKPIATRAGHTGFQTDASGIPGLRQMEALAISQVGAESPNGNTVAVEDQLGRAAEARLNHEMALGIMQKSIGMLRAALGRP
ncbi:MAG: flagellar basal body protein [Pseudomonadota bacterium]